MEACGPFANIVHSCGQTAPGDSDNVLVLGAADKPPTFAEIVLAFDKEMRRGGDWACPNGRGCFTNDFLSPGSRGVPEVGEQVPVLLKGANSWRRYALASPIRLFALPAVSQAEASSSVPWAGPASLAGRRGYAE
jgi:hypothetical protein